MVLPHGWENRLVHFTADVDDLVERRAWKGCHGGVVSRAIAS
ncbi:hypothetical protein ACNJ7K_15635 [Rhodococcus aetherivorans]